MRAFTPLRLALAGAVFFAMFAAPCAQAWQDTFTPRGIGGAGGMYCLAIAPDNPDFILMTCDMGGVYRSLNGGEDWQLLDFTQGLERMQFAPPPVFAKGNIYWVSKQRRLCFSKDSGLTWIMLPPGPWEKTEDELKGKDYVSSFALLPGEEETFLVSTASALWVGAKLKWAKVAARPGGPVVVDGALALAGMEDGSLLQSLDSGKTWTTLSKLPGRIMSVDTAAGPDKKRLILAAVDGAGLMRSTDGGKNWNVVKQGYENETILRIAKSKPNIVYAAQTKSVLTQQLLRSDDGGATWRKTFLMPPPGKPGGKPYNVEPSWLQTTMQWGYFISPGGFAFAPGNPDFCLLSTQGEIYRSKDGGRAWQDINARQLPAAAGEPPRFQSRGLEVTTSYGYRFNPHDPSIQYILYADIGFAMSKDNGESWSWSAKGSPWRNTFYDLDFDPAKPGLLYAAASTRHDHVHFLGTSGTYPEKNRSHRGGIVVSDDWGATWKTPYTLGDPGALPDQVCTSVAVDPKSPPESRVLFAAVFGENEAAGVYISRNGGKNWQQTESQPGILPNRHLVSLRLHPVTGDLYCLVSGFRSSQPNFFNPEGGGLWVSSDHGKNWKHLSKGSALNRWATAFTFDPKDKNVIYVASASPMGNLGAGAVYRTEDGGEKWTQILTERETKRISGGNMWEHYMAVAVHPDNPELIFAGTTMHGLLYSENGGKTWRRQQQFPFANAQYITFDPRDHDKMIISTYGSGVWSASVRKALKNPGRGKGLPQTIVVP